jgi:hypothetical protein
MQLSSPEANYKLAQVRKEQQNTCKQNKKQADYIVIII